MVDFKQLTADTNVSTLITLYDHYIKKTAVSVAGYNDQELLEDLAQEGRISIFKSIKTYDGSTNFHSYLSGNIRYAMMNYMTNFSRTVHLPSYAVFGTEQYNIGPNHLSTKISIDTNITEDLKLSDLLAEVPTIDTDTSEHQRTLLKQLLNTLTPSDRKIMHEYYYQGLNIAQLAAQYDCSRQWVNQRLNNIVNKLQKTVGATIKLNKKTWRNM